MLQKFWQTPCRWCWMGWEVLLCFGDEVEGVGTAPAVAPLEQDLAQGSHSKIKLGDSGLMPGQTQHLWAKLRSIQKLSFLLCCWTSRAFGLVLGVFFWFYLLFLNPPVWKRTVALCAQYFSVTPSTFCVYVFFQVHSGLLKLGGIIAPALLSYLFQSKHNQNLKARGKLRQKRYAWIGNISRIFQ